MKPLQPSQRYGQRVVAFIDLLGVGSQLSDPTRAETYAGAVVRVLDSVAGRRDEGFYEVENLHSGRAVEIEVYRPEVSGAKVTTVSDAIVVSLPLPARLSVAARAERVYTLLHHAYDIQRGLLMAGFRSRGAVCIGGLIHTSSLIVARRWCEHIIWSAVRLSSRASCSNAMSSRHC